MYLDGRMNLQIMYEKYVEDCTQKGEVPAKIDKFLTQSTILTSLNPKKTDVTCVKPQR